MWEKKEQAIYEMDVWERVASAWTIRKFRMVAQYYLLYIFCEVCTWNVIFMYVGTWIYLVCFPSDTVVASWTLQQLPLLISLSHISGTSAKIAFVLSHCYLLLLILPLANHIKIVKGGFGDLIIRGNYSEIPNSCFLF